MMQVKAKMAGVQRDLDRAQAASSRAHQAAPCQGQERQLGQVLSSHVWGFAERATISDQPGI